MNESIIKLGKDTATYGISTIVARLLNFLLVPFYTNVLLPSEYGITAYVFSLIAFLNVIYNYGMESAYFKYSSTLEIGSKKQNFSTPFFSILFSSFIFSVLIISLAKPIELAIDIPEIFSRIVIYSAIILFFDALSIIPFALLRQSGKAKIFAGIKIINIVINVTLNVVLLIHFKLGVEGIFISGMAASFLTFVLLIPIILRNLTFNFSGELFKNLLKFGLPSLPAGFALMMLQVIDRPILKMLTDDSMVGIYQANYKLGIFMMLIVSMFDYAWKPFFFNNSRTTDAKEIFARVTTYFLLIMAFVFLTLTLFIDDLVKIKIINRFIIHPDYWHGLGIVPIILLGYLFNGLSLSFSAGIYIEKKTYYLPIITISCAMVNIAMNFMLIPSFGILGAAFATLISYAVMAILMFIFVQSIYKIKYEYSRWFKIIVSTTIVTLIFIILPEGAYSISVKFVLLLFFLPFLYLLRFFARGEISYLKKLVTKSSHN